MARAGVELHDGLHGGLLRVSIGAGKRLTGNSATAAAGAPAAATDGADALAALRPGSIVESATVAAVHGEVRCCSCFYPVTRYQEMPACLCLLCFPAV